MSLSLLSFINESYKKFALCPIFEHLKEILSLSRLSFQPQSVLMAYMIYFLTEYKMEYSQHSHSFNVVGHFLLALKVNSAGNKQMSPQPQTQHSPVSVVYKLTS